MVGVAHRIHRATQCQQLGQPLLPEPSDGIWVLLVRQEVNVDVGDEDGVIVQSEADPLVKVAPEVLRPALSQPRCPYVCIVRMAGFFRDDCIALALPPLGASIECGRQIDRHTHHLGARTVGRHGRVAIGPLLLPLLLCLRRLVLVDDHHLVCPSKPLKRRAQPLGTLAPLNQRATHWTADCRRHQCDA